MLTFLIVMLAIVAIVFANIHVTQENGRTNVQPSPHLLKSAGVVVGAFLLITFSHSFGIVQAGARGVVTRFGAVEQGRILPEGLYMVIPIVEEVHVVDTQVRRLDATDVDAVTSDRQTVKTWVAMQVQIDPAQVDQTWRNYRGELVERVVEPKFQEAIKTITARYNAADQIHYRPRITAEMYDFMQRDLAGKGVIMQPAGLQIVNFQYNKDYQDAIEQTAVSQQNRIKAENQLQVAKVEAQTKVATARGDADSQGLLARTLTDKTLANRWLDKWDGHLSTVSGGNGANIIDISKLIKE
jgi:regulator of protease activity HflC (stomatin/prohibitin superfamily)